MPRIFSRGWPKVCSAARLNSVMIPCWLMVMMGSSEDSRMARFRPWASARAARTSACSSALAVDDHQARGATGRLGFDPKHFRVHVDELAGLHVAEPAAALPAPGLVDRRPGRVAQFVPRFLGVKLAQVDGRGRPVFVQPHQVAAGRIQVEGLAVRGGQADELGGRIGQQASQGIGIGPEHPRPVSHRATPPHLPVIMVHPARLSMCRRGGGWRNRPWSAGRLAADGTSAPGGAAVPAAAKQMIATWAGWRGPAGDASATSSTAARKGRPWALSRRAFARPAEGCGPGTTAAALSPPS